jgi:outer membrane protein OmpA-like peptidoglycan-associated protein
MLTGIGLDVAEGTELQLQRDIDALRVQVASNDRNFIRLQDELDNRGRLLHKVAGGAPVYFDIGRASLKAGTVVQLQQIVEQIKLNPHVRLVEIHGHSDDTGKAEENLRLSAARARTVATFFGAQGFPMDRMKAIAHGSALPVATNATPEGKQLNRRVEVVFIR